jgi:Na+-translocating ferredoxin:NAD+ oxidoreductase RnfG subunit
MKKYLKFKYLKPAIVLGSITTIISTLLIVTSSLLPDTSNIITERLRVACVELMGEGEFFISEDFEHLEQVNKVIIKADDRSLAFEITTGGFKPPDGITVLVAMNKDGTVRGVVPVLIKDTPSYGNKTKNPDFLAQFENGNAASEFDGVTGATYSSKGVIEAVFIAIEIHEHIGGFND